MFNKDDLIILGNEYVSAATINLDCIDVCESIVGQLVYLYESHPPNKVAIAEPITPKILQIVCFILFTFFLSFSA